MIKKLLISHIDKDDLKIVEEMLAVFDRVDKVNKRVLEEYIDFKYKPSPNVMSWAEKIFNDIDDIKAKIVMYEVEHILAKK